MTKVWRALCILVFLTGVGSLGYAQKDQTTAVGWQTAVEPMLPYSVVSNAFRTASDGSRIAQGQRIRFVRTDDDWRQERYSAQAGAASIDHPSTAADSAGVAPGDQTEQPDQLTIISMCCTIDWHDVSYT